MAKNSVVLAFFNDEASADDAVAALKAWDEDEANVRPGAIGVLVLDDTGKIKAHKLGRRSIGKGAGIGMLLAVIAPPTLLAGAIGGGLLGAFHHKGLGLSADERDRVAAQLSGGKAAVGLLVEDWQVPVVSAKLAELGGTAEAHEVTDEAIAEVAEAAPAVEAAEVDEGDDLTILDGIGPATSGALRAAGVTTFAQLSELTPEAIEQELATANVPLVAGHNAGTWPHQAKLAAAGDWAGLRRYIASTNARPMPATRDTGTEAALVQAAAPAETDAPAEKTAPAERMAAQWARWQSDQNRAPAAGGAVYGLGMIGALVYFLRSAESGPDYLLAIPKAVVWPALLVFRVLKSFYG